MYSKHRPAETQGKVHAGTIVKDTRNADPPGRYAPPEMVGADPRDVFGIREDGERPE